MKKLKKGMKFVKPCLHLFAPFCLLGQMSHAITDNDLPEGHVQDEELSPGTHGVEFNMTELANMEFLLWKSAESNSTATVGLSNALDWSIADVYRFVIDYNEFGYAHVIREVSVYEPPDQIFGVLVEGKINYCGVIEEEGTNETDYKYTMEGEDFNFIVRPEETFATIGQEVQIFTEDILDPSVGVNVNWTFKKLLADNHQIIGNDEGEITSFTVPSKGDYVIKAVANQSGYDGERHVVLYGLKVVDITFSGELTNFYRGTSKTLTAVLSNGGSLPEGMEINWTGHAEFSEQNGLNVVATFIEVGSNRKITASLTETDEESKFFNVAHITQFVAKGFPNNPKCQNTEMEDVDFSYFVNPDTFTDNFEIYGDEWNTTEIGEHTVFARLSGFTDPPEPVEASFTVLANMTEEWQQPNKRAVTSTVEGVAFSTTYQFLHQDPITGLWHYKRDYYRGGHGFYEGDTAPVNSPGEPIWSLVCGGGFSVSEGVNLSVTASAKFSFPIHGVDVEIGGSIQQTNTYTISQDIPGFPGKKVGLRGVDHPYTINMVVKYPEIRTKYYHAHSFGGIMLLNSITEWTDLEPPGTKTYSKTMHLDAGHISGVKCENCD